MYCILIIKISGKICLKVFRKFCRYTYVHKLSGTAAAMTTKTSDFSGHCSCNVEPQLFSTLCFKKKLTLLLFAITKSDRC